MSESIEVEDSTVPEKISLLKGLLRVIRPHQWVKNLFVLAPVFFAKRVFDAGVPLRALGAVAVFCILSGAVYTLNDIVDVEADRIHPKKRHRPIASGAVPIAVARIYLVVLAALALGIAGLAFHLHFFLIALAYFLGNIAYSLRLKKVPFLDVACISAFFVLRVLGGGYAIHVRVSIFMIACTALLALFLGFGKRRHEIAQVNAGKQRAALEGYSASGLDTALALTGTATLATYVAYTVDSATIALFQSDQLWMTAPQVLIALVRFVQLVMGQPKAESPTQEMLRDLLFVLNLAAWGLVVLGIIYRLHVRAS